MGDVGSTEAASGFIKSVRRSATSPLGPLIVAAASQNKEHGRREGGVSGGVEQVRHPVWRDASRRELRDVVSLIKD